MSSFFPNIKFAADHFFMCLSYVIENLLNCTGCRRIDVFSVLYYSGSAVINVNIKTCKICIYKRIYYFFLLFHLYEYVLKNIGQ